MGVSRNLSQVVYFDHEPDSPERVLCYAEDVPLGALQDFRRHFEEYHKYAHGDLFYQAPVT